MQQQINLPQVNLSRSEKSLEVSVRDSKVQNAPSIGGSVAQPHRKYIGSQTMRSENAQLSSSQLVTNQLGLQNQGVNFQNIQNTQDEKLKTYSRKFAKIVSNSGAANSNSNTRTPNSKKKFKNSIGIQGQTLSNQQALTQLVRSGNLTARRSSNQHSHLQLTSQIYSGVQTGRHISQAQQIQDQQKNIIKSAEKKGRKVTQPKPINPPSFQVQVASIQGYSNSSFQRWPSSNAIGSMTQRNPTNYAIRDYSPKESTKYSPLKNESYNLMQDQINQLQRQPPKQPILNNFSNQTYYQDAKKNSQSTHSFVRKSNTIQHVNPSMSTSRLNISGSQTKKRGSIKKDSFIHSKRYLIFKKQEVDLINTTRSIDNSHYLRQGTNPQSSVNQSSSNNLNPRRDSSSQLLQNQSSHFNQSEVRKLWFSPVANQRDNSNSNAVSPKAFLNRGPHPNQIQFGRHFQVSNLFEVGEASPSIEARNNQVQKIQIFQSLQFSQNFHTRKVFQNWACNSRVRAYQRKRNMLQLNHIPLKSSSFCQNYKEVMSCLKQLQTLSFTSAITDNSIISGKSYSQFNEILIQIKNQVEKFQQYILKSNQEYEKRNKDKSGSILKRQNILEKEDQVISQRCKIFDYFLQFTLYCLSQSLTNFLILNKDLTQNKLSLQLQLHTDKATNEVQLLLSPVSKMNLNKIKQSMQNCDQLVFNNKKLNEVIGRIVGLSILQNSQKSIDQAKLLSLIKANDLTNIEEQVAQLSKDYEQIEIVSLSYKHLTKVIEFEKRWNYELNELEDQKQIISSSQEKAQMIEDFTNIINEIPHSPLTLNSIKLDFRPLYNQLQQIPQTIRTQLEQITINALEKDTQALKSDLKKAFQILELQPTSLNIYVEQVNTLKLLRDTMQDLNQKHDSIKKLSVFCQNKNGLIVHHSTQDNIKKIDYYIANLPNLIKLTSEKLNLNKQSMENQMLQSYSNLYQKMQTFQTKYLQRYIFEIEKKLSSPQQTISEIQNRQKMIDEIRQKVHLYQECIQIMNIGQSVTAKYLLDFQELEQLHKYTLILWTNLEQWTNQQDNLFQKPFLSLQLSELISTDQNDIFFLEEEIKKSEALYSKLEKLIHAIVQEQQKHQRVFFLVKDLKNPSIKLIHWNIIFEEMGQKFNEQFTIQDLLDSKIFSHREKVLEVLKLASYDYEHQLQLQNIKEKMSQVPFQDSTNTLMEELYVQAKRLTKKSWNDQSLYQESLQLLDQLNLMQQGIDKLYDCQKQMTSLDVLFQQDFFKDTIPQEFNTFSEVKAEYLKEVQLLIDEKQTVEVFTQKLGLSEKLDKIQSKLMILQKTIEDMLESKRLAFPRFFFMTDSQFQQFLNLTMKGKDFSQFLNLLFPGVKEVQLDVHLKEQNQLIVPPILLDMSLVPQISLEQSDSSFKQVLKELEVALSKQRALEGIKPNELRDPTSTKSQITKQKQAKDIIGLISNFNEILILEKKVPFAQQKCECWLQGIEQSMQETIGKLISNAVNTFPKQSLDEWILDYPQQVILTTIHLILTHEINELFEEIKKVKQGEEEVESQQESDDASAHSHKTPDTRDLVKHSQASHRRTISQVSSKSMGLFTKKENVKQQLFQNKQRKIINYEQVSLEDFNKDSIKYVSNEIREESKYNFDQNNLVDWVVEDEASQEEDQINMSREKKKFTSNMFGSQFEIDVIAPGEDDTMKILQEKSFRGLFLRLQFWINQICKSLHISCEAAQHWKNAFEREVSNLNAPPAPDVEISLNPVQKIVMQSIINFLSYMRDVVYELQTKKIESQDDFEWQKQMRLTWNGKEYGCKVDCGAWTCQQANEYLGAQYRIPITPLTNKYFVFISAALREKSAVLFRCIPSHDYSEDIYSEFSNICTVPFKKYSCNDKLSLKNLMQFLNGAALASMWIFFEHVDKLEYVNLQTFNKEIQMVQQQFIIAELSQDSTVITAHINRGYQTTSQNNIKSQERGKEQTKEEQKRSTNKEFKILEQFQSSEKEEIKIEEHGHQEDLDSFDSQFYQRDLSRQKRQLMMAKPRPNEQEIELSGSDFEEEFEKKLQKDNLEILEDPNNLSQNGGKPNNKICFGVFASISHQFNMKQEKWASDLSNALQSAFRVLSLTKPEMVIITQILLKSEGFSQFSQLGTKINQFFGQIYEFLKLGDRDDSYTITVRDIRRICFIAACDLNYQKKQMSEVLFESEPRPANKMMTFSLEKKSKQALLNEIEKEEAKIEEVQSLKYQLEDISVCKVLQLSLIEKVQSLIQQGKLSEERIQSKLQEISEDLFGRDCSNTCKQLKQNIKTYKEEMKIVFKEKSGKGYTFNSRQMEQIEELIHYVYSCIPTAIVGESGYGKSTVIKLVVEKALKKQRLMFDPSCFNSHSEMYGVYDPKNYKTLQMKMKNSIVDCMFNTAAQPNKVLVVDGEYDYVFSEFMLPYLEYQSHENKQFQKNLVPMLLPNGMATQLKSNIPIIFEIRTLKDFSPRLVSNMKIINFKDSINIQILVQRIKFFTIETILDKFSLHQAQAQVIVNEFMDKHLSSILIKLQKLQNESIQVIRLHKQLKLMIKVLIQEVSVLNTFEEDLQNILTYAILCSIGLSVSSEFRPIVEEQFKTIKELQQIQGNIFNYYLDLNKLKFTPITLSIIDLHIVPNYELYRHFYVNKLLLKQNRPVIYIGKQEQQKSTFLKLVSKYVVESQNLTLKVLPMSCFLNTKFLLKNLNLQKAHKTVFMIDDYHLHQQNFNLKLLEFFYLIQKNKYSYFSTDQKSMIGLMQPFQLIGTSEGLPKGKNNAFIEIIDLESKQFNDLGKAIIKQQFSVNQMNLQQLHSIVLKQQEYFQISKEMSCFSTTPLKSLHLITTLIKRVIQSMNKVQKENNEGYRSSSQRNLEILIQEFSKIYLDRVDSYPLRTLILNNFLSNIKEEFPSFDANAISSLIQKNKSGEIIESTQKQQIVKFIDDLTRENSHLILLTDIGNSQIEELKSNKYLQGTILLIPEVNKYKDAQQFINQINKSILESLKRQKSLIVFIEDYCLRDLVYFDYICNLIQSFQELALNTNTCLFESFFNIVDPQFSDHIVDIMKEDVSIKYWNFPVQDLHYFQQNSPHHGQTNLVSPSNLQTKVNEKQLIIIAAKIICQRVHFVVQISDLDFYSHLIHNFPSLEKFFQINFFLQTQSNGTFKQIVQQIQTFNMESSYKSQFIHQFKTQPNFNSFSLGKGNLKQIQNSEEVQVFKKTQEINLSIPIQHSLSQIKLQQLKKALDTQPADQLTFSINEIKSYSDSIKDVISKSLLSQRQCLNNNFEKYKEMHQSYMSMILKDISSSSKQHQSIFTLLTIQDKIESLKLEQKYKEKTLSKKEFENNELLKQLDFIKVQQKKNPVDVVDIKNDKLNSKQQSGKKPRQVKPKGKQVEQEIIPSKKNSDLTEFDKLVKEQKQQDITNFITHNCSLINIYRSRLIQIKDDIEDLKIKERAIESEVQPQLRLLDLKELKQMKNESYLKSLIELAKKNEQKLDKVKIRMKNLEGDCIILAFSLIYLGPYSIQERMNMRKKIASILLNQFNLESSDFWQNTKSEKIHSKYYKKVIQQDLGLKKKMFQNIPHLFIDSLFCEFLFALIFCPSVPVIYDCVGIYQQYLTEEVVEEINDFKSKVLFSSDSFIGEKLNLILTQKDKTLCLLNDTNDYTNNKEGKSCDSSILHKLANDQYFTKIDKIFSENLDLKVPKIIMFSAYQQFNLNSNYLAKATILNTSFVNKNEAWIEVKEILLKHFLPDNYQKLKMIKIQSKHLKTKLVERHKEFEQMFFLVKAADIERRNTPQYEELLNLYAEIKLLDEDYQHYNQAFHAIINEHPLLASYSNIFVILFYSLKELQRFTGEITYSWKIYSKIIDMIIAKIIRDLTMKQFTLLNYSLKNKEHESELEEAKGDDKKHRSKKEKKDKEFTIDEEFFHSVIMPSIYSTIVSGIRQEHISLFNLLFSFEIALKKTTVSQEDKDFFIYHFFQINNCYDWRLHPLRPSHVPNGFVEGHDRMNPDQYQTLKKQLIELYPALRALFETVEIKIGKNYTYKDMHALLYLKMFKNHSALSKETKASKVGESNSWKDLPLIQKLNIGFLCPNDEWRSMLCQFVYEELTTIFDFSEDLNKLHNFIKTASWSIPVALFTQNSINIVNTVCSIASYYGVGLEVLRIQGYTKQNSQQEAGFQKSVSLLKNMNNSNDLNVLHNLKNQGLNGAKPIYNEAAVHHYDDKQEKRIGDQQFQNFQMMFMKDELEIDEKQVAQNQSSIDLIQKCAENGTWVLISTLKFPSFWYEISKKLEKMSQKGKIMNTFRLFFDLQGYSIQEIPESFLFNHSVKFYLTEKNNEDMEGFNDVWANILNDDLLNAKDLNNVMVLDPPSELYKVNLNLQSNLINESSIDNLIPYSNQSVSNKDQMKPNMNNLMHVKDDKIPYAFHSHQSKDSIFLPMIFTEEQMKDILVGGRDLYSPKDKKIKNFMSFKSNISHFNEEVSEIFGTNAVQGHFESNSQSFLMENASKLEGNFIRELNQVFPKTKQKEERKKVDK